MGNPLGVPSGNIQEVSARILLETSPRISVGFTPVVALGLGARLGFCVDVPSEIVLGDLPGLPIVLSQESPQELHREFY